MTKFKMLMGMITVIALISGAGCAYKTHSTRGDKYMDAGEAELAAEAYEKSLNLKSDQPETRQKLARALNHLERWRQTLVSHAMDAESSGYEGLSLLLYTKANQLRPEPDIRYSITQLENRITSKYGFHAGIVLKSSGGSIQKNAMESSFRYLPKKYESSRKKIQLTRKKRAGQEGDYLTVFEAASSRSWERAERRSGKYISGTMEVDNPEYIRTLETIDKKNHKLKMLRISRNSVAGDIIYYERMVDKEGPTPNEQTSAEKNLKSSRERLTHIEKRREYLYEDLIDLERRLRFIPGTVTENIYAVKEYMVRIHTTEGRLPMSVMRGPRMQREEIKTIFTDESHRAQPLLGLAADPRDLPGEREIDITLMEKARERLENIIVSDFNIHRQRILNRANKTADSDRAANLLLIYCFLDPANIPEHISLRLKNIMAERFGRTGNLGPEILRQ